MSTIGNRRRVLGCIMVTVAMDAGAIVLAQAPTPGPPNRGGTSVHRPWVGVGAGLGGVLGTVPAGGTNGLLASTFDLPLTARDSLRFSAERLWSSVESYGASSRWT